MIHQFFILSPRGDTIIYKDWRGDASPNLHESFFRKANMWEPKGDAPPIFQIDGFTFVYVRKSNLLIACTTKFNISPSVVLELLNRMSGVFKDYCGILTEESIRKNFILIYELLDEMIDFGYPQITATENLKVCVHNEPSITAVTGAAAPTQSSSILLGMNSMTLGGIKTKPSVSSNVPIALMSGGKSSSSSSRKNEIYVDIIEKLSVLFNPQGHVVNSSIDGSIVMKSFLAGNPELRLALNEDLIIGRDRGSRYGAVVLDDCNFHECVQLDEFEQSRTLHFVPPEGEFKVLNYRISTGEFRNPFKLFPVVSSAPGSHKLELTCTVLADIPEANNGINVVLNIPVPRCTVTAVVELPTQRGVESSAGIDGSSIMSGGGSAGGVIGIGSGGGSGTSSSSSGSGATNSAVTSSNAEYSAQERKVIWTIKKFPGATEMCIKVKVTLDQPVTPAHKKELGPISMDFEIPMYNLSNLQVRYLRISETDKSYNPYRWVRYITASSSYVYRM